LVGIFQFKPVKIVSKEAAFSCSVLILILWFGNFFEFDRFSLYADDWAYLGRVFSRRFNYDIWLNGIFPYSDGRPIQFGLIELSGYLINCTGSFGAAYIALFLITALSVLVTWWALTYRFSNAVALIATAVIAISPLVSVRPFLNGIATPAAVLFLMVAGILHVSGRKLASYLVAALILLSYEMVFPLFVLLPALLKPLRTRGDIYRLFGHALICAAMILAYAVFKDKFGGSRLTAAIGGQSAIEVGWEVVATAVGSFANGVAGSVDLGLWLAKIRLDVGVKAWAVVAFAVFGCLLHYGAKANAGVEPADRRLIAQTVAVLLLMALAGYGLSYFADTGGAQEVLDRGSRLHSAAVLPFGVLTAMALVALLEAVRRSPLLYAAIAAEAGYLAVMFAFSVSHQDEFAAEAERQRLLVTQLVIEHPLMDPQASFIIEVPMVNPTHHPAIEYEDSHSLYFLLRDLFDFGGKTRDSGPTIRMFTGDGWRQVLTPGPDGRLDWPPGTYPADPAYAGHIWCYELTPDGRLHRVRTPILVGGRDILHEGPDVADGAVDLAKIPRLPLFDKVMGSDTEIIDAVRRNVPVAQAIPAAALP
jgi:hypothetical protein